MSRFVAALAAALALAACQQLPSPSRIISEITAEKAYDPACDANFTDNVVLRPDIGAVVVSPPGVEDPPTVVYLHGGLSDSGNFNSCDIPFLEKRFVSQGYRAVWVDYPDFQDPRLYGEKDADAVLSALDALDLRGPVYLIGTSRGGLVAANVLRRSPGQFAAAALICPLVVSLDPKTTTLLFAPKIDTPVYVFHSKSDELVPFQTALAAYDLLGGPKSADFVEGARHCYAGSAVDPYERALAWFALHK